jgi:integrase/recombinase XerD
VRNYSLELRLFFAYFNELDPLTIGPEEITLYMNYLVSGLKVGRAKCRMAAQSFSFFYKHVLKKPFQLPSKLYPRQEFKLPEILSQQQAAHLYTAAQGLKNKAIVGLLYGAGLRLNELRLLKVSHIDSKAMQIKVVQGKGNKDRFTLLPHFLLQDLRTYYQQHRPQVYLFEGQTAGKPMHARSIQHALGLCYKKARLDGRDFTAHTLRHSFATHLLDEGTDIHTIKQLLGHTKIETTMVYLHLQQSKRALLVSPLDKALQRSHG